MAEVVAFADITDADRDRVGGKGLSLARCVRAGLGVPDGFVVTTDAFRRLSATTADAELIATLETAYSRIGAGPVAVRSSAVAEDGADASFAGQQDTVLDVVGVEGVVAAVARCWKSASSERGAAYRQTQGVGSAGVAMAVVVQRMVPADVAGVLFTRDPANPTSDAMLIEAAAGLGEAVVSGRVQPDSFRVRRDGTVLERPTALLSDTALSQLADLGRRVEAEYGDARDIEWAIAGGQLYLLQARPITTGSLESVRHEVIADLRTKADGDTVWARYNLCEVLAEPTPMTWAVVGRLLAADGGFGLMNRDFGATPDPALGSQSAYDLVAGRPMVNLSRLPRMQFPRPPFEYPFAALKADPASALNPQPVLNPWRVGLWKLPGVMVQLSRMTAATKRLSDTFADSWPTTAASFAESARAAMADDWSGISPQLLLDRFTTWVQRTLVDFARESLKPTVLADAAWQAVVAELSPTLGTNAAVTANLLSVGATIPPECDLARGYRELSRQEFLTRFGHRGANEMELSAPRWAEDPSRLPTTTAPESPATEPKVISDIHNLSASARTRTFEAVRRLRLYLGLREAGKHHLLLGYAVIRRALVELDRRFDLNGGIFFLTPDELPALIRGDDLNRVIAQRRKRRRLELALPVPAVLFSDDLDAIGRPPTPPADSAFLTGIALSPGVAEGPAVVLTDPSQSGDGDGFILVCPSTDPAWVPLFARARGLMMETGGVLSHGAIVAREFGLPAVAGLPGVVGRVRTGDRLRVDGNTGRVDFLG